MNGSILAISLVAGTFLTIQAGFKMFDTVAGPLPETVTSNASENPISDESLAAILDGQDPTDILEATAAGSPDSKMDCRSGNIVGDLETQALHDSYYVAYQEGSELIIQVSPWLPTYLVQDELQSVSATEFAPKPENIEKLSHYFANRDSCQLVDLYLNRVVPNQG